MAERRIKCPTCGSILRIACNGDEDKVFICPKCHDKHKISECKLVKPKSELSVPPVTPVPHKPVTPEDPTIFDDSGTEIGGAQNGDGTKIIDVTGYIKDTATGTIYALKLGTNTIGRKAQTCKATIKVDDPSGYMSRDHAKIDVKLTPDGPQYIFQNTKNQNSNHINGKLVNNGDILVLNDGDRLDLAQKIFIFKTK